MLGPSVFPDQNTEGLARGQVFRMLGSLPECLVLQYLQIQVLELGRGRVFRMLGPSAFPDSQDLPERLVVQCFQIHHHTRMLGPSVFPDSRVIPEWLVLQQNGWFFSISRLTGHTRMGLADGLDIRTFSRTGLADGPHIRTFPEI